MKKTFCLVLAAAFGLSACSSLENKSAHEMMAISLDRIYTDDYSYNIDSEVKFHTSTAEAGVAPESEKKARLEETKKDQAELDKQVKELNEDGIELSEEDQTKLKEALLDTDNDKWFPEMIDKWQEYPVVGRYLEGVRLKSHIAIDLPAKKAEWIPAISINHRNEQLNIQSPMLIDGENLSLTIDQPLLSSMIMSIFTSEEIRKRLAEEQPISIQLKDEEMVKGIPLRHAAKAVFKAYIEASKAAPAEAYRLENMDEFGKQNKAKYRIHYTHKDEYDPLFINAFAKEFKKEFDALKKKPEEGSTAEGYEKVEKFFGEFIDSTKEKGISMHSGFEKMVGMPLYYDYYLNGKGRLLATRIYTQVNSKSNTQALNIVMESIYHNYGKPVFKFKPASEKVIDIKELTVPIISRLLLPSGYDPEAETDSEENTEEHSATEE